jgi:hypothetical protein
MTHPLAAAAAAACVGEEATAAAQLRFGVPGAALLLCAAGALSQCAAGATAIEVGPIAATATVRRQ